MCFRKLTKGDITHKSSQTLELQKLLRVCTGTVKMSHGTTACNSKKQKAMNVAINTVKDVFKW